MISRINLDGKERVAIVLSDYSDFSTMQSMVLALNNCIQAAQSKDMQLNEESLYYLHDLLNEMMPTVEQMGEMITSYFGHRRPAEPQMKSCDITF